ncbi:MBL fold metallo-hydrolase [Candidatus Poribacteria bacterium]|nr:MBL fold metallo-hydrolase [Candidatus Poribacteria bacterium]
MKDEIAIRWWGCMSVEINIGDVNIGFDPYVKPDAPKFDYLFCSHDHYDHCHEETLRKLIVPSGRHFKMLFAARGCFYASRIDGPNNWGDTLLNDLKFVPREKCIALYPKYCHDDDPPFGGPTETTVGRLRVEGFRSDEDPQPGQMYRDKGYVELAGSWPNMGYLVTDTATGRAFAHTGDVWKAYPQMEGMRGKVDVLFYPLGKLPMEEKVKMMEFIRPKIAVPTHYRRFEPDFPIPAHFPRDGNPYESPETLKQFCLGHWYPSPEDPPKEIAEQRERLKQFTRVVELKAGVRYLLPDNLEEFKGHVSETCLHVEKT